MLGEIVPSPARRVCLCNATTDQKDRAMCKRSSIAESIGDCRRRPVFLPPVGGTRLTRTDAVTDAARQSISFLYWRREIDAASHVEFEVDNVAVADDVVLAFKRQLRV